MKILKPILAAAIAAFIFCPAARAALTAVDAAVLDGSGNKRTTFTNLETIALRQVVSNSVASDGMIQFAFTIHNPAGGGVFHHEGNSVRAVSGNSNSQLSGLAISRFYSVPGIYTFVGEFRLAGEATWTKQARVTFQISSPNINLIYPPYGATGLMDKPLTFRWVASGASTYKITVAESAGIYDNPVHTGNAAGGMYTYPDNPTGPREILVPGKTYYWKVEGLDATGTKIADSTIYSFTLGTIGSTARNIAVTSLELDHVGADKTMHFNAVVKNTGGTTENGVAIKMSLGGMPAQGSPKPVETLAPNTSRTVPFMAFMPEGQEEGLAVACVDIFDDNIPDNCKTKFISNAVAEGAAAGGGQEGRKLSYQEIWEEVIKRLGPDASRAMEGYTFDSIECANCAPGELNDMMLALMNGDANLTGAAVSQDYPTTAAVAVPGQPAPVTVEAEPEESPELDMDLAAPEKSKDSEWSGYTNAVKDKDPVFYTVKSAKVWEKDREMLSSEEAPKVEFGEKTIVGIVAGTGNKADSVRIIARRKVGEATVFDYYMTESAGENPAVPYIFKTYDKVEGKIEFKRIDVGGKQ
jgi:hypothetical protein